MKIEALKYFRRPFVSYTGKRPKGWPMFDCKFYRPGITTHSNPLKRMDAWMVGFTVFGHIFAFGNYTAKPSTTYDHE